MKQKKKENVCVITKVAQQFLHPNRLHTCCICSNKVIWIPALQFCCNLLKYIVIQLGDSLLCLSQNSLSFIFPK